MLDKLMNLRLEVVNTMKKALIRISEEEDIKVNDIRLKIFPVSTEEVGYLLMNRQNSVRRVTINDILNEKAKTTKAKIKLKLGQVVDKSKIINKGIMDLFLGLSKEESCHVTELEARIHTRSEKKVVPELYVFKNGKPLKPLDIGELLSK